MKIPVIMKQNHILHILVVLASACKFTPWKTQPMSFRASSFAWITSHLYADYVVKCKLLLYFNYSRKFKRNPSHFISTTLITSTLVFQFTGKMEMGLCKQMNYFSPI